MPNTGATNNPTGINGYGVKNYLPDKILQSILFQYSKEWLTVPECLMRLCIEFKLVIGKTYLHALNKQFNVPSPCKPPSEDIVTQAVLVKVAEDINQEIGVNAITSCLSTEGMPLP
ncbi:hypothetical protein BKA82DRAFT_961745 [Pisolithus tinctorius]|uniref:Uncharacterized protein n=1 Tax=Pisolithus tinctorius Marx 270 TaxID=870435 RepID=A0A0C3IXM5_PISTI|nr:hypothetical protein BKA82DRAFT_961745 [Pisolithus tinctorius]KIO01588.1 hypothetical protein M404DRAFT_961745 [Pisolithus tinctorius Marx 270]